MQGKGVQTGVNRDFCCDCPLKRDRVSKCKDVTSEQTDRKRKAEQ